MPSSGWSRRKLNVRMVSDDCFSDAKCEGEVPSRRSTVSQRMRRDCKHIPLIYVYLDNNSSTHSRKFTRPSLTCPVAAFTTDGTEKSVETHVDVNGRCGGRTMPFPLESISTVWAWSGRNAERPRRPDWLTRAMITAVAQSSESKDQQRAWEGTHSNLRIGIDQRQLA